MSSSAGVLNNGITLVVGLCGANNGGKTSLAQRLQERHANTTLIQQDDFYKEDSKVPVSQAGGWKLWDVVEAIQVEKLVQAVAQVASSHEMVLPSSSSSSSSLSSSSSGSQGNRVETAQQQLSQVIPGLGHLVLVEGTMLLNMRELRALFDVVYFITLDRDTMHERRSTREYSKQFPDPPGYFDDHLWPAYMRDLKEAHDGTVRMLDGCKRFQENFQEVEAGLEELCR